MNEYTKITPNEYQALAARTLIDEPGFKISGNDMMIIWNALGLAGESGEVVDHIKKGILHQHGIDKAKVTEELGDVLWYVAGLCTKLGIPLEDVMIGNIDKLTRRYPNGYSAEDSRNRAG